MEIRPTLSIAQNHENQNNDQNKQDNCKTITKQEGHDGHVSLHWLINRCIMHLKISVTFLQ